MQFDTAGSGARAPRVLHCGHTFCTACLGARIRRESARKWCIECPVDGEETFVPKGNAVQLGLNHALVAELTRLVAAGPRLFRVHIKNLAGDSRPLVVAADITVGDLKRRIHEAHAECAVHLQRLLIPSPGADGDELIALRDDAATLGALGIDADCVVTLVVRDGFRSVEHVRAFGSAGSDSGQFDLPWDVCVSVDGDHLFVVDFRNNRVQVVRATDGAHVRTIGACVNDAGRLWNPSNLCLSRDGILLFVSDLEHRVQVFRAADGMHVRTIGSKGSGADQLFFPRGVCLSPDDERLYVVDSENRRVQVYRAADGAHMRSIDTAARMHSPSSCCISSAEEFLFVSDNFGAIQVFCIATGAHVRSVGDGLVQRAFGVQLSPCDAFLFVADQGNQCVRMLSAIDSSACELAIRPPAARVCADAGADRFSSWRPRGIRWTRTPTGEEHLFVTDSSACCLHHFSAF